MTRNITSTTPAGVAGLHLDADSAVADMWASGDRDAFISTYTDAAMTVADTDPATAVALLGVARTLTATSASGVNPYTEARIVNTFMHIGAAMMATASDAARSIIERGDAGLDAAIIDRVGDPHRVPESLEVSSGQTYGAGRKPRRAVGPWVRAALETRPGSYMTDADIARWAMSIDPATGRINGAPFGLTDTETGLTGRIGAWRNGAECRDDDSIMVGHSSGVNAMMYIGS